MDRRPVNPGHMLVIPRDRTVGLLYLALGLLLFAPVTGAFFLSDDFVYLSEVAHPVWPGVLMLQPGVFRPLHVVTWLVDYQLWGLNPVGYHLTNILSHCITAFLVLLVAKRLFGTVLSEREASWASVLAGLVFLMQPSHTEAVSWIIGRHDILATLFVLCSWHTYMRFRERPAAGYLAVSLVAFLIAPLFKESVVTFPLVLLAYEAWLWATARLAATTSSSVSRWKLSTLFILALGVYLVVRRLASGELVAAYELAFIRPSSAILANLAATVFRSFLPYLPVQLLPNLPRIGLTNVTVVAAGITGAAAALVFAYRMRTRPTPVRLLLGFLGVALIVSAVPTLAVGPSIIDSEGERYAYLPSVFASIIVGLVATTVAKTQLARALIAAGILIFLGVFLELSNENWHTAGDLSRGILYSLQTQPQTDELTILVLPDDLNGAFIYRNGLAQAIQLFGLSSPRANVVASVFLKRADELIALDRAADAGYSVSIPAARGALHLADTALDPALTGTTIGLYRIDVVPHRPVGVWYYSGGGMQFAELTPSL